ncbi:hypothetical protein PUN4_130197 [Paraburkholderia unamae]|nr:hypothetical protein PUN4_130197 [Paraburkholderia unamae]
MRRSPRARKTPKCCGWPRAPAWRASSRRASPCPKCRAPRRSCPHAERASAPGGSALCAARALAAASRSGAPRARRSGPFRHHVAFARRAPHSLDQRAPGGRGLRIRALNHAHRLLAARGRQRQPHERPAPQVIFHGARGHEPHCVVLERQCAPHRNREQLHERRQRRRAPGGEQAVRRLANQRAERRQHERKRRELRGQARALGERMPRTHHHGQRLVVQLLETQADHALRVGHPPHGEADRAGLQPLQQFRVGAGHEAHAHARPLRREVAQRPRQQGRRHRRQHANIDRRGHGAFVAREQRHALAQRAHAGARVRHEKLPFARGHRAVATALEQLHAEHQFQFRDRLRDGGLRDRQTRGGLLHAAHLRHSQKALEMTEFDASVREPVLHNDSLYEIRKNIILHNFSHWIKWLHRLASPQPLKAARGVPPIIHSGDTPWTSPSCRRATSTRTPRTFIRRTARRSNAAPRSRSFR